MIEEPGVAVVGVHGSEQFRGLYSMKVNKALGIVGPHRIADSGAPVCGTPSPLEVIQGETQQASGQRRATPWIFRHPRHGPVQQAEGC